MNNDIQSAEEFLSIIRGQDAEDGKGMKYTLDSQDARIAIMRRDAAQRQAGREEERERAEKIAKGYVIMKARYAALVEAARPFAQYEDGCALKMYDPARVRLGKALREIDEVKGGK